MPSGVVLTRSTTPSPARTKISTVSFVSFSTRLLARDSKAIVVPSALTAGWRLASFPPLPSAARLTILIVPVARSSAKMSLWLLSSSSTRFDASDLKAMTPPSPEMAG